MFYKKFLTINILICSLSLSCAFASDNVNFKHVAEQNTQQNITNNNNNPDDVKNNLYTRPKISKEGAVAFENAIMELSKTHPNLSYAFGQFQIASDNGYCQANGYLGQFYASGLGISQNYEAAVKVFEKGSACGDDQSFTGLADAYANGNGVQKDIKKATELYQKAALNNYAPAQYELALIYLQSKNHKKEGRELMKMAAKSRYQPAISYYYEHFSDEQD